MQRTVIFFALIIAAVLCADQMVLDQALINEINSSPKATWVAGENAVFKGKTMSQIRHMFGAFLVDKDVANNMPERYSANVTKFAVPESFDARTQWPSCTTIGEIRNQGQCGSCWAFSATEAMADRFCIASKGSINKQLSPQDMVSCDKGDMGCQGGYLQKLWQYFEQTGVVSDNCLPYKSGSGYVPACPTTCSPGATDQWHKYKAQTGSTKNYNSVAAAQADIMANGPIQAGFKVYRDFFSYKSGVYKHVTGSFAGGHAIKILGWGKDATSKLNYWIVANSWGETWGMNGYFWIELGHNECDIESNLWMAQALL